MKRDKVVEGAEGRARTRGSQWLDENIWTSPLASTQERFKEASDVIRR